MGKWIFILLGGLLIAFIGIVQTATGLLPSFLVPFVLVIYAVALIYMIR